MTTLYETSVEHTGRLEIFEDAPARDTTHKERRASTHGGVFRSVVMTLCFVTSVMCLMAGMTFFDRMGANMISGIGMALTLIFMSGATLCAFVFVALE